MGWRQAMTSNAAYGGASSGNTSSGGSGGPAPSIEYGSDQGDGRSNAIQNQIKENQRKAAEIKANNIQKEKDKQAAIAASQANIQKDQKQHKLLTALNNLAAKGKGDTEAANSLKRYLAGVVSPYQTEQTSQEGTSFADKYRVLEDFYAAQASLPIDYSGYGAYDADAPMGKGFGSVFGASSGELGKSSKAVTDSIKHMFDTLVERGINPNQAASIAFDKFYPEVDMLDPVKGTTYKGRANLMGDPKIQRNKITQQLMGGYSGPNRYGIWGNYGGGGGGDYWDSYYSGGGGGGGGGGGYREDDFTPRGNPNDLWGQQAPWLQAMISTHGGPGFQQGFARGGIVSLVT